MNKLSIVVWEDAEKYISISGDMLSKLPPSLVATPGICEIEGEYHCVKNHIGGGEDDDFIRIPSSLVRYIHTTDIDIYDIIEKGRNSGEQTTQEA